MKLTKRLLAIVLAAAMLVGMVVISTSAVQLDDAVESLTWDDCVDINAETNPYTVKMGFKIYKVDTATGEYTLLADTNSANDTLDVSVEPGDVLRVETWAQTNFHTIGIQLTPAYNNAWLLPTTMDYSVVASTASHPLKVANAGAKTPMSDFGKILDFCDEFGTGDGTFENPVFVNEALTQAKGQINHNSWGGLRGVLPKDWQGKAQTEAGWINTAAVDQWGNSIVDADGHLIYNVYQFGMGNNATGTEAWVGYGVVLNVYQPIAAFNLTVADDAAGTSKLFFPESSYKNTTNAYTQFTAMSYEAVQDSPNVNGNWDESMPQVCSSGLTTYANKVTYGDGTVADKNWIVTNATITVGGAEGGDDETTTEAPTEPPVEYADLTALQAAIAAAATADTANCTAASVAEFNAALAAANALNVEGTLKSEQATIDAAAARLNAAITGLTKLGNCDYAALDAAIATVVDTTNCTSASVKAYNDALAAAKAIARGMIADEAGANQATIDAATAALNAAIAGLTKLGNCDYAALDAAIAAYEAKAADSYKYANWADYTALYEAAKAVTRDMIADEAGANQKAIDDAATALNNFALVEKTVDYTAWNAAVATIPADLTAYTPNSVAAFEAAKAAAEAAKDAAVAAYDQAALDAAAADLAAAVELLAAKADKAALAAAIAAAPTNADAYTPDSWAAADLANVLAAANAVNADANATQDEVNAQVAAIAAAEAKLVMKADKAALAAAIAGAEALDEEDYTPESWAEADLATAIADAKEVLADDNATAAAVEDAIQLLRDAALNLVEKADTDALEDAIATLPAISEEDATPETWADYEAALAAAQLVLADANATQDEVDAAEANLLAAIAAVQEKETVYCDYTALDAAIADYEAKVADKDLYANWAEYEAAYDAAKAIARGTEYSEDAQAAIDAAAAALNAVVLVYKAADYAAVDAAKEAAAAIDATLYTDDSYKAVTDAVAAVVDGLDITKQAEVDAFATAINNAIAALEYKAADYTAVEAAKAAAAAIDASKYTSASVKAVTDAVAAVVDGLDITKQAEVDAFATAINDAIAALDPLAAADYAALDAALALVPDLAEDDYTAKSWKAYADAKAAAEAISRDLLADEAGVNQKAINDAAAALVAAYEGLKENKANVTSVDYDNTGVCTKGKLTYEFTVNGAPSKIQVIGPDGGTMTFDRRSSRVTIVSYNEAGEVIDYAEEDPAYEVWSVDLTLDATDYQVRAKYDYTWDTEAYPFTVEYAPYNTTAESFTATVGQYVDATEVVAAKGEVITFKAVTDASALKVQFVFADGGTSTYTKSKAVDNGDGTLTWTITRVFSKSQDINLRVKAPTGWATEYSGNVVVTIG